MTRVGPAEDSIRERHWIDEAHPQQRLGRQRRPPAAQAIQHHWPLAMRQGLGCLVVHRGMTVDFELEQAARDVDCPGQVTVREFLRLAHIDDWTAEFLQLEQLGRADFADQRLGGGDEVADGIAHAGMIVARLFCRLMPVCQELMPGGSLGRLAATISQSASFSKATVRPRRLPKCRPQCCRTSTALGATTCCPAA